MDQDANSSTLFRESWYDADGRQCILTCDDTSCLLELIVENACSDQFTVEILQQPVDRRGLSFGPAITLLKQSVHCDRLPNGTSAIGLLWLPSRLVSRHLRNCYFRVSA